MPLASFDRSAALGQAVVHHFAPVHDEYRDSSPLPVGREDDPPIFDPQSVELWVAPELNYVTCRKGPDRPPHHDLISVW
jgi:hypothetical protein